MRRSPTNNHQPDAGRPRRPWLHTSNLAAHARLFVVTAALAVTRSSSATAAAAQEPAERNDRVVRRRPGHRRHTRRRCAASRRELTYEGEPAIVRVPARPANHLPHHRPPGLAARHPDRTRTRHERARQHVQRSRCAVARHRRASIIASRECRLARPAEPRAVEHRSDHAPQDASHGPPSSNDHLRSRNGLQPDRGTAAVRPWTQPTEALALGNHDHHRPSGPSTGVDQAKPSRLKRRLVVTSRPPTTTAIHRAPTARRARATQLREALGLPNRSGRQGSTAAFPPA